MIVICWHDVSGVECCKTGEGFFFGRLASIASSEEEKDTGASQYLRDAAYRDVLVTIAGYALRA